MNSDAGLPVGAPVPRVDSFTEIEADGPPLSDEERAWPVVALRARGDSFEVSEPAAGELEVVIRVRCAAPATPDEVRAYAEQLRSAVEGVPAPAGSLPVQIALPTQTN